jgi:hypothetical protein
MVLPIAGKMLLAMLLLVSATRELAGESPTAEPPATQPAAESLSPDSPRELLKLFGIDQAFWNGFVDGRLLDANERENLLRLLYRLQQFGPGVLSQAAQPPEAWQRLVLDPSPYRGEVFSAKGRVQRATREPLTPDEQQRLRLEAWYRCDVTLESGQHAQVYAIAVPAEWKLDAPLDERVGFDGIFLKQAGPVPDAAPPQDVAGTLLFAAKRVAWYPQGLLGDLQMDFGLFDTVSDRTRLSERECFYQLLAAVKRASPSEIDAAGRKQLAELREFLPKLISDPDFAGRQRTAARRALARAERNASDVVPLFNEPDVQRGKLFVVRGDALRAIEIRVTDPDIVARFGIDHYYEVELVTDDSQSHPIVCCVAELPKDMPRGERIHVPVVVSGFFLKSWAYSAGARAEQEDAELSSKRQLLAPLLIARSLRQVAVPGSATRGVVTGVGIALVLAVACAVLGWLARGDRGALRRARRGDVPLPERIELEGLGITENEQQRDRQDVE